MRVVSLAVGLTAAGVVAAACGGRARTPASPRTASGSAAAPASAPGAAPGSPQDCARCHPTEASEWDASLHHASFTDADFQRSFGQEPSAFCFDCHAPQAKNREDARGAAIGVGCTSCHSASARHGDGTRDAMAPPVATTTTTDCTGCHEFTFPGRSALMQSTVTEHARSPFASTSCASCHLPVAADGHRDHRFDVTRNTALLRASIDVQSRRTDKGVEILLATRHVGHAMPTGDLFRRLRIVVRAEASDGSMLGEEEVVLARRFERTRGLPQEIEDTRLRGDQERRVVLDGPWVALAERVTIEARYERVAQNLEIEDVRGRLQRHDSVFASIVLAEETLSRGRTR